MKRKLNAAVKNIMIHLLVVSAVLCVSCWSGFDDMCANTEKDDPDNIKLTVMNSGANSITLTWEEPSFPAYTSMVVTWSPGGTEGMTVNEGQNTVTIDGLGTTTEYTVTVKACYSTGYISGESSFKVTTGAGIAHFAYLPEEVNAVRDNLSGSYILMSDVDLGGYSSGTGWVPIGTSVSPFTGKFDGNGHVISNLTINNPAVDTRGFFGKINNAIIKNLNLENVNIKGRYQTGGIAAEINGSTEISNCTVSGIIHGMDWTTGGFIAEMLDGTLTNCSTTATVNGVQATGGFIGELKKGTITDCHSSGNVEGAVERVGGFAGYIDNDLTVVTGCSSKGTVRGNTKHVGGFAGYVKSGTIVNCYATGNVISTAANAEGFGGFVGFNWNGAIDHCYATGNVSMEDGGSGLYFGGFVGHFNTSSNFYKISNSYARGKVTGSDTVGGFAGFVMSSATIELCYATGEVAATAWRGGFVGTNNATIINSFYDNETTLCGATGVGSGTITGVTGESTENMKKSATFSVVGWDFTKDWDISSSVNDGYPYLR